MPRRLLSVLILLAAPLPLLAQNTGMIQGKVTVEGIGRPLPNAQVGVVGLPIGTQTNEAGDFRLTGVPAGPRQVRVQRLGFAPATQAVTVVAGQTVTLNLSIREAPVSLEQVVVTATGETRKKEISNSMSTISAAQLENAPVVSTQQMLTAQSPGVTVLANSGQPGAGGVIKLRGNNSISQGNNPIIYVDGVRIFSGNTPNVPNARQNTLPLNDIRAEDIDRVEIVKGAAATTLYGTEASGGVIQIFTKRGQSGAPRWTVEITGGTNDLESAEVHGDPAAVWLKQCRGPLMFGIDITRAATLGDEIRFEDPTCPPSNKWIRTGIIQRYNTSVAGGTEAMQYYFGGNLSDEEGAIETGRNITGGFRGNFSFRPRPNLEIGLNSSYQRNKVAWVPDGNLANGFSLNVMRGLAGNYRGPGCATGITNCMANADALRIQTFTRGDHYISGLSLNYTPIEAWTNRLSVGLDYVGQENRSLIPYGHQRSPLGQLSHTDYIRRFLSMDYASTYRKPFGAAWVSNTSFGGQVFQNALFNKSVNANDFAGPGEPTITSAAIRTVGTDSRQKVVNAGLFAQEQISWRDRAFVTLGVRIDGNSAFGEDFGLQTYPKIGLAYVLSDHDFWPKAIETFKVRGAIGESGKAPGAFDAVRTWSPIAGDEAKPGFTPNQEGNATLGPERTREMELGFEASAYGGRFAVDATYFNTTTSDALIGVRSPPSQGFLNTQLQNVGEVNNKGLELKLDAGIIRSEKVDWRGRINYTQINSKAVDLGGEPLIAIGALTEVREGYPVPALFAPIIKNPNEKAAPQFDATLNEFIGPTFPDKITGIGTTLTLWGNLMLDALGEFQYGGYNINYIGFQNANRGVWRPCYDAQKKLAAVIRGTDPSAANDLTALERARCAIDRTVQNAAWFAEATDFFRLRHVTLTYQIPQRWLPRTNGGSVTLSGRNLWLNTDYSGLDPESADQTDSEFARREYYQLPQLRSFSVAFRLNW
ncbi:MAG TPA: SusC/RagA family TonB-linked outer membrane protein [Gemmatimonadaceae bacterium]|nr:SusC/RagA family TonB-linked outer membrane protein [Gemmatimonadaceae bacterium]